MVRRDNAGTWLFGDKISGSVAGDEEGVCLVEIATGMPTGLYDWVDLEGIVQTGYRASRITMIQKVTMGRVKN